MNIIGYNFTRIIIATLLLSAFVPYCAYAAPDTVSPGYSAMVGAVKGLGLSIACLCIWGVVKLIKKLFQLINKKLTR